MKSLGRYELFELIGSGATAEVYQARDTVLGRDVALKVLKPALVPDPSAFARFVQEAQAAAKLFHNHIATVLDMGDADGRYFIAMRYVPGKSLDKILIDDGPLPWDDTLRMVKQIGEALDFAHSEGFLHRDVKPSNILCDNKGDFWLTDFGLTRAMMFTGLTSHTGAVLGTPSYIAPEIWNGEKAVPQTDLYALACVTYETITGEVLFVGDTPPAVMTAHVLKGAEFTKLWPAGIPVYVELALRKALTMEPEQRYINAETFTQALSHAEPIETQFEMPETIEQLEQIEDEPISHEGKTFIQHEVEGDEELMTESLDQPEEATFRKPYTGTKKPVAKIPAWVWILGGGVVGLTVIVGLGMIVGLIITGSGGINEILLPSYTFECEDPIGCVTYGPGEPVRIASALVISGPNTDLGTDSQYGVEIAIELKGEILGHAIELQAEDDGCSAEGGQAAGQKIVSDPTIVAVVGTSCSGAGVPMSEVVSEAGYAMVSPSNTAPSLTDPDQAFNPGYLRTAHNDKVQGKAMADFAYNVLGVTTAAAIHDGDPYTEGLAAVFAASFEEIGGTIVEFTAVNKGDTDMRPVLSAVAAAGPPELLYYPVFTAEGGFLTKQAKEVSGLEGTVLSAADGMISSAAIEAVGEAGEGMYFSGPDLSFSGSTYESFLAAYVEKYGSEPISVFHAHSFDAANIIFACIEEVAVQDGDSIHIGRQALRTCLYATSGFEGITGSLTCNEYGDCADPKISVSQLLNGGYGRVWP